MKPYEMTKQEYLDALNEIDPNFQNTVYHSDRRIARAAQKKLLKYLNDYCTEHPISAYPTGTTYLERKECFECLESLAKDFGLDE